MRCWEVQIVDGDCHGSATPGVYRRESLSSAIQWACSDWTRSGSIRDIFDRLSYRTSECEIA